MEINYDQLPLIAGLDGHLPEVEIPAENPTPSKCPEFPYFGARYPDAQCIGGKLYDLDKCDDNGNLDEPTDYNPCPFCRPKEFMEQWDMTQEEYDEYLNDLKKRGYE